jgi:DNA-binding CsgD family transcriptional regulator
MLVADDQRRGVTANSAACSLLGIALTEVPWRRMDEFMPAGKRGLFEDQWKAFLASGAAEGWHQLAVPGREPLAVEFSATAHVLPGRHLAVFVPLDAASEPGERTLAREARWVPVAADGERSQLTEREQEVLTLVASGFQSDEIAERLFVSPETVKSHVHNAMNKLGVHTRAHAVAVALVTAQITWEMDAPAS